jgi:hypothetical protein
VRAGPGKHRHDERPGIPRDADGAGWQGGLATKESHRHPILEKVVVDDEPGDFSATQRPDDAAYTAGGRFDHR